MDKNNTLKVDPTNIDFVKNFLAKNPTEGVSLDGDTLTSKFLGGNLTDTTGEKSTTPISSASSGQEESINTATGKAKTGKQISKNAKYLADYYGVSTDDIYGSYSDEMTIATIRKTIEQQEDEKSALEAKYKSQQQSLDQEWESKKSEIEKYRKGTIDAANAAAYAANPYAATGTTTSDNTSLINQQYDTALTQAKSLYDASKAALTAGNGEAAAKLMKAANQTIEDIKNNAADIANQKALSTQKAAENANAQQNVWADNFRSNLTSIAYSPEDIDTLVSNGTIYKDPTFLAGVKSMADSFLADPEGTTESIINTMKTGSLAKQKADQAAINAANLQNYRGTMTDIALAKLLQADEKLDRTDRVGAINSITNEVLKDVVAIASPYVKDDEVLVSNVKLINTALAEGKIADAKKMTIGTVLTGFDATTRREMMQKQAVVDELTMLKKAYQEYSKTGNNSIIDANMKKFANYLGINVDPNFTKNDIFRLMVQQVYRKSLTGAQFSEKESKEYNAIFPQGKDSTSLKLDKLDSILAATESTIKSNIDSVIGEGGYDKIKNLTTTGNQVGGMWNNIPIGTVTRNKKDGKLYIITANGPVLK